MANFFAELKRRHIYRVAAAYAVLAWLLLQIVSNVAPALRLPKSATTLVLLLLLLVFPIALLAAWAREFAPADGAAPSRATTKLDYALMVALVIVIGLVTYQQLVPSTDTGTAQQQARVRPRSSQPGGVSFAETCCVVIQPQGSSLVPVACWFEVPDERSATCYRFTVPERRQGGGTRSLTLPVAILSATKTQENSDPILYLGGGPGFAIGLDPEGIMDWWSSLDRAPWLKGRALILMDQRGTGLAKPSLDCPEIERTGVQLLRLSGDMERRRAVYTAAADACRQRWQREGYDLDDFGTVETAADFADLRRALGIREWNVYGISYGTRLALVLMRDHPDGIRSTILDSAYPLEQRFFEARRGAIDGAFRAVSAACHENAACRHETPDIGHDLGELIERYGTQPLPVSLIDKSEGPVVEVSLTGALLLESALEIVEYGNALTELPALIRAAKSVDKITLEQMMDNLAASYSGPNDLSEAKYFAVDCEEEAPFVDLARLHADIAAYPRFTNYGIETDDWYVCANWVPPGAARISKVPVTSDIPTLVLQGAFDATTPPAIGRLAASHLQSGYFIEFPNVGHGVLNQSICGQRIAAVFFSDPGMRPPDSCLREEPQRPLQ